MSKAVGMTPLADPAREVQARELIAAVIAAEVEAQRAHEADECHLSEWSRSYCEAGA